jgi:YVTN family beta-propeller protein
MQHMKEQAIQDHGPQDYDLQDYGWGSLHRALGSGALATVLLLVAACGPGDGDPAPNTPLTIPMALVVNQDDTTLTTLRLDGQGSPVIGTLSLGPAQRDAIGGVAFSLGEWIFVTHTAGDCVWTIDPIAALAPIREDCLTWTEKHRVGQRPRRIVTDPVDKNLLWTLNEGDPATGIDDVLNCLLIHPHAPGGSATVLQNAHIAVGGAKPSVAKATCLFGRGEQFIALPRPVAAKPQLWRRAFISSRTTGLVTTVTNDPRDGQGRFAAFVPINLCNSANELALDPSQPCPPGLFAANRSAPAGMFWSQATGMIYSYLSGYNAIVEIDPDPPPGRPFITRRVDGIFPPPTRGAVHPVGITPDGRFLFLVGEDLSDANKVVGRFGVIRVDTPRPTDPLTVTWLTVPALDHIRPAFFQFTPDGRRLYVTQSNSNTGLNPIQANALRRDRLLVFLAASFPAAPSLLDEVLLPASEGHGMDLWITGPPGAGSAKGIVVTNATPGVGGSVSLIDAASNRITATIPVGRNPKQVTVYYVGLAASDNQATPRW